MSENKKKNTVRKKESKSVDVAGKLSKFIEKKRIQNEALKKIVDEFSSNEVNKKNK
jgi:hypothetical protein